VLGYTAEFAEPGTEDIWGDFLSPPGGPDPGLHARMLALLEDAQGPGPGLPPGGPLPPVGDLRTALGL
jgi:hypothetical protein